MKKSLAHGAGPLFRWSTLFIFAVLFITPFVWTLSTALKRPDEISRPTVVPCSKVRGRIGEIMKLIEEPGFSTAKAQRRDIELGDSVARSRAQLDSVSKERVDAFEREILREVFEKRSVDSGTIKALADSADESLNTEIHRLGLFPEKPQWGNFYEAWTIQPFTAYFRNTALITFMCVIGGLLSSSMAGYGFARFKFRGRNALFMLMLGTMMVPSQVTVIPLFWFWSKLGFVDTFVPMILPSFFGSAFMIFFMRQYFLSLPKELVEAAEVDGASPWQTFWQVMMPNAKPALVTLGLLAFFQHWDDFFTPLLYLNTQEHYTVSMGLRLFQDQYSGTRIHLLMAAALIHLAPCVILFLLCQRYFVRSIVLSGIKG